MRRVLERRVAGDPEAHNQRVVELPLELRSILEEMNSLTEPRAYSHHQRARQLPVTAQVTALSNKKLLDQYWLAFVLEASRNMNPTRLAGAIKPGICTPLS